MNNYFKIFVILALRVILRSFYFLHVKDNRILFSSFVGKSYNCSPKYIYKYLQSEYGGKFEYVWCVNDCRIIDDTSPHLCVKYLSIKYIYYLLTSKVIISNQPIEPFLPKRKSQLFINTTHGGGAYKKGGIQAKNLSRSLRYAMKKMKYLRAEMTDYVISSCQKYTDVFSAEIEYNIDKSKFLPIGMPRNDLFFKSHNLEERRKICQFYELKEDTLLIIYAPTYRGHYNHVDDLVLNFDSEQFLTAVENKFNKKGVLLFRHHVAAKNMHISGADVIDVSDYQDMQELLAASDIFITDYSSCLWDFSFTYRPGFLYVPDLKKYKNDTDFHIPIDLWPFPYAETMEQLCCLVKQYDPISSKNKIDNHHRILGSFEKGTATEDFVTLLNNILFL